MAIRAELLEETRMCTASGTQRENVNTEKFTAWGLMGYRGTSQHWLHIVITIFSTE